MRAPTAQKQSPWRLNLAALGLRLAVGIFGKQTAGYVQAMTAMTTLKHNVMFNGPVSNVRTRPGDCLELAAKLHCLLPLHALTAPL